MKKILKFNNFKNNLNNLENSINSIEEAMSQNEIKGIKNIIKLFNKIDEEELYLSANDSNDIKLKNLIDKFLDIKEKIMIHLDKIDPNLQG